MLSKRLSYLKSLCPQEEVQIIWDIGCDHGELGTSFLNFKNIIEINLVDASEKVISQLRTTLIDSYITIPSKIKIQHSKGQKLNLTNQLKKTIFIAGMGGDEICEILIQIKDQLNINDDIIISPHRKILELRRDLISHNFRLKNESIIQDGNQFYQIYVLTIDPTKEPFSPFGSPAFWTGSREAIEYKNLQIKFFSQHRDALSLEYVSYLTSLSY